MFLSISLVTTGTTPHLVQMWNCAVSVPKTYRDTWAASAMATVSLPVGLEVHTPPCFVQKEQVHARAGMLTGSGSHSSSNVMFPQWQLPEISMSAYAGWRRLTNQANGPRADRSAAPPASGPVERVVWRLIHAAQARYYVGR